MQGQMTNEDHPPTEDSGLTGRDGGPRIPDKGKEYPSLTRDYRGSRADRGVENGGLASSLVHDSPTCLPNSWTRPKLG